MSYSNLRFFAYARKSTDREDKQVQSTGDQISELRPIVQREKLQVREWLEEARSAKRPNLRPVFRQMIDRISQGEADAILCWKLDRLSRNPEESGLIQQLLQDGRIRCIRTPERTYLPEDNAVLFAFEASMANQYVRNLKSDVERGVRKKAERGWWPYQPPPGYVVTAISKELEPHPTEFLLLRRAWDLLLTGAYTVPQVLERLNGWGYRCKRTKSKPERPLSRTSLYRIFTNPFYCGRFRYQGVETIGRHQPMVDREEFLKVQAFLCRNQHMQPQRHAFPFTGYMRCGICGCLITAERKTKTYKTTGRSASYTYYHCTGRRGCSKHSVSEDFIAGRVLGLLECCRVDSEMVSWALATLDEVMPDERNSVAVVEGHRDLTEKQLENKIEALFSMREEGEITADEFKARKTRYQNDLFRIQDSRERHERDIAARRNDVTKKLKEAVNAYEAFAGGIIESQRQVVYSLASSYVLTLGNLEIELDPVYDMIRTFEPSRSGPAQVEEPPIGPDSSVWRAFRDNIRNLILSPSDASTGLHLGVEKGEK